MPVPPDELGEAVQLTDPVGAAPPVVSVTVTWQVALALGHSARHGWSRFDCVQPRYNLLYREIEAELLPLCRDQGLGVIAYNPLAGGFLSGRYQDNAPPPAVCKISNSDGSTFCLGWS